MKRKNGGIIHTYQKYDPKNFPSPTQPPPDLVSGAFEHMLMFGQMRPLSQEELARAVRIDPSQIKNLGPSMDALIAILLERKKKILETYETRTVIHEARGQFHKKAKQATPPPELRKRFRNAVQDEQIYDLERLWYATHDDTSSFARQLVQLIESLGEKYQIDELAAKYDFTGRTAMTIPQALAIKEELEKIDELLKQLEEAKDTAQIGIIDLDALKEFAEPEDMQSLGALREYIEDYVKDVAARQGLEHQDGSFQLTPKSYRLFQSRLLERIFSDLEASRTGRHEQAVHGDGAIETQATKEYEFGDSLTQMDIPQSFVNAMLRSGNQLPIRLEPQDIVVHKTRNTPKCSTVVIMDMSGSMRYDGQYINVKRMALALDGLIHREYPGDYLQFIEMYTFAKRRPRGEIIDLLPKPVTIHDPIVRLKEDMSRDHISEYQVHPHFTNIQHSLKIARQLLSTQDSVNRQVILITDGLPTAHFEGSWLYMLYPPDPLTEEATLREAALCQREGITINIFLVPSWSQTEEDIRFAYRLAESTEGRVFFTAGRDLDRFVIWDYVKKKREII